MSIAVSQATIGDLADLVPLFDAYRQFYGQASDPDLARRFLFDRFEHAESIIFIARDGDRAAVGFTQLYPSFSSTRAARIFVLNDLFVTPPSRKRGVAAALLAAAADHGRATGADHLTLSTANTNLAARALYKAQGWRRDDVYLTYDLPLS